MIVIDYSQTIISNLMAEIGSRTDVELDVNLLRHMVINTIRSHKVKFGKEFGEVVIACDSRKYWRKEVFPYYKANRKKAREDSGFNWPLIFDSINLIKEEFLARRDNRIFPYNSLFFKRVAYWYLRKILLIFGKSFFLKIKSVFNAS